MNNLNILYNMMMQESKTARLPSEYQEVEYIEAPDRTLVWVNTGIPWNNIGKIVATMQTLNPTTNQMLFNGGPFIAVSRYSGVYCTATPPKTTLTSTREKQTIVFSNVVSSSGETLHTRHWDGAWDGQIRYFDIELYDKSGTMISKLVPCYRKSDKAVSLYDIVRNVYIAHSGSHWRNVFIAGGDVL